jgi:hypothetical protein
LKEEGEIRQIRSNDKQEFKKTRKEKIKYLVETRKHVRTPERQANKKQ